MMGKLSLLELIGFSWRIWIQLTWPSQLSNGCIRSSLPRIGPQEVLIQPTRLSVLIRTRDDGIPQRTP
ncbi:unnamed protein product [Nezara viridula]|uniref:Neuropeptide n=1 Tax=Nezara viridula TaxID=85310 RepID=A0A9P0GVJ9_NEZVI|nr:unnamed protein product [Nezara viridula]